MRNFTVGFSTVIISISLFSSFASAPVVAHAANILTNKTSINIIRSNGTLNLISNPSVEVGAIGPTGWYKGHSTKNITTFSYPATGYQSTKAVKLQIMSYVSGDDYWYFSPVVATPGVTYAFSDYYTSSATSYVTVQYRLTDGTYVNTPLLTLPAASTWTQAQTTFVAPATAATMTILHSLHGVGTLTTDNFYLALKAVPISRPAITSFSANPASIEAGQTSTLAWTVTGASTVSIDQGIGTVFGTSTLVSPATTTVYTLTASNSTGVTTATSTTVTVRPAMPEPLTAGVVSLTFDDGLVSQYANALPILTAANIPGSFYIITNYSLVPVNAGYFITLPQVLGLQAAGEEIGVHTKSHPYLTALSTTAASTEISGAKAALIAAGINPAPSTLTYPYGDYNSTVKQLVANAGLVAARSTESGYNSKSTDLFALKTRIVGINTTFAEIQSWIDTAIADKLWLILTFHDIDALSTLTANGQIYGTTPAILQQMVSYLSAQRAAGTVQVKTLRDALPLLR